VLTVLSVAYPFAPVSRDGVGGAEQVLFAIDRALVERGHRSLVIAEAGSRISGALLPVRPALPPYDEARRREVWASVRETIRFALGREPVDVVHLHGIDAPEYVPTADVPVVVTLHLPLEWYPPEFLASSRVLFTCVSRSQRRTCPENVRIFRTIDNGVDLAAHRPSAGKRGDYVACLGRICPEKGFDLALDAARRERLPLVLAGHVFSYPDHVRYFEDSIRPLLDRDRRFVGALRREAKRRILGRARCLVIPSRARETSSLVAMEALACGTPVVALRTGALPDILEDRVTGLLVDHPDDLGAALRAVSEIDPAACRRAAELRFDERRMTSEYLALYADLCRLPRRSRAARAS
jgi:glycosyltransferase involved in cell wall biosynthesis